MKERDKDLEGKVAIVTGAGAAGGIGFETARILAEAGAKVVLTGRRLGELESLTNSLKNEGLAVAHHLVDISEEKSVEELIFFTVKTFGRLDTLVNNASLTGLKGDMDVMNMSVDLWDKIMETNARGYMLMCKHSLPELIKSGGGSIINVSSSTALTGYTEYTAYACSKGAINTLTLYVATQYGNKGIRCNAITPGPVMTSKMGETIPKALLDLITAHHLIGRMGKISDIAEIIRFLASDHSSFITGQVITIDGGFDSYMPAMVSLAEYMAKAQH